MLNQAFLLPLRDVVVFPHSVLPLFVGRDKSIRALELAMAGSRHILLVTQKNADKENPDVTDLYEVGTLATIMQLLRLPDGTIKVLVEGKERVKIKEFVEESDFLLADIELILAASIDLDAQSAMIKVLVDEFTQFSRLTKKVPDDVITNIKKLTDLNRLTDTVASHLPLTVNQKQELLGINNALERAETLLSIMQEKADVATMEKRIRGRVKQQMEKNQKEYYLNEQIKAIHKELGDLGNHSGNDFDALEVKIKQIGMPAEAEEKALAELNKLKSMPTMSAEATVLRSYLDWMVRLPWKKVSRISKDLKKAQEQLDTDHYGLEEVKERILEFLAVQARMGKTKGPILCLVGPPGVGKTSLAQSIATATNRKFVRMALGGVRDEAEIRGHRRTYIGSLPGKIIQRLSKVGVNNPLFLLDEIDKMGMDMRGDPASALLEVLDPEQNSRFNDHYLEVDYDLSNILFICTANSLNIPSALRDRMEVIRISGYTETEKLNIARRYLLPKQLKAHGFKKAEFLLGDEVVLAIIRYYTKEAGVRGLEREIEKLARKVLKHQMLVHKKDDIKITQDNLGDWLGVRRFTFGKADADDRVGQVTGLAWTSVGGELLTIEAVAVPGKGKVTTTGSLGEVMQESIQAAMTVARSHAAEWGIRQQSLLHQDFHIHVPEGATPKDGPSAGVAMCLALVSVLTGIKVRADIAMTGEITLRGLVLPIGGLKEKLLAAHRGGIKRVIIPKDNEKDLVEVPDEIKQSLEIFPVSHIDEALVLAFCKVPVSLSDDEKHQEQLWMEKKYTKPDNERIGTH